MNLKNAINHEIREKHEILYLDKFFVPFACRLRVRYRKHLDLSRLFVTFAV